MNAHPGLVERNAHRIIVRMKSHAAAQSDIMALDKRIRQMNIARHGIAPCLGFGAAAETAPLLDLDALDDPQTIDIARAAQWFAAEAYTTRSRRCAQCAAYDSCSGMHVDYIRAFGYSCLEPMQAEPAPGACRT